MEKPPADQTKKHQSKTIAKDHDSETTDMITVEDLSNEKETTRERKADQTHKEKKMKNHVVGTCQQTKKLIMVLTKTTTRCIKKQKE